MKRSARKGRARVAGASGQALVPALIFLLVGCIGLYMAFNTFQMTSAKIKLQNTADAAAYSAAVLQARDYNFSAYTNRAMIANQVTAAQVVALKSWIDELDATYTPSDVENIIALADHPTQWSTPKSVGKRDIAPVRAALDALLPTAARNIGSLNRALSVAQANYHAAILSGVPSIAEAVAQQNQPDTHATTGYFTSPSYKAQLAAWTSYTGTVTPAGAAGSDEFADVVTDRETLDRFVKNRHSTRSVAPNFQQLNDTANTICGAPSTFTVNVTHDGGTQLRNDKVGWQSIDASTAQIMITCIGSFPVVAGSGGSANGNITSFMARPPFAAWQDWEGYGGYFNFGYEGSSRPGWQVPDAMAQQFRDSPGPSLDPVNGGLLPYQEVNGAQVASQAPRITIEVTRSSNTLVKTVPLRGGAQIRLADSTAAGAMRALSSANAYFVRPDETSSGSLFGGLLNADQWARADRKTEYPSLFSPYWQATLAPVSDSERQAAQATQISAAEWQIKKQ